MRCILAGFLVVVSVALGACSALAAPPRGLDLAWASGARNVDVSADATVCTLLVRPAPGVATLPAEWRLIWTGRSSGDADSAIVFLAAPGPAAAAAACAVDGPATDAEREAHQRTVTFCGPGDGEPTAAAAFVVRIGAGVHARIAAVAASSAYAGASDAVDAAAEVTINGGSDLPYPPVVWSAHTSRDAAGVRQLVVQGIGLDRVQSLIVRDGAPDASAAAAATQSASADTLSPSSVSANVLTSTLPAALAAGQTLVLSAGADGAATALTLTPAQTDDVFMSVLGAMYPDPGYLAKDFAFIYGLGQFHVFYIRKQLGVPIDSTENDLGHAVWSPTEGWTQLPPVLAVRPGKWDDLHVWAPSIVYDAASETWFMYYTGVTRVPFEYTWYQRIGVATSKDLMNWTRYDEPVFSGNQAEDVYADSSLAEGCQFRDAFVMADPAGDGGQLMYYAATPIGPTWQMITHVARNDGGLTPWESVKPLWNTDYFLGGPQAHYVGFTESPHVFSNGGRWYLFYTSNSKHRINFEYASSPTADSTEWSGQVRLFNVMNQDTLTDSWYASEHLKVGHHEYFAFVNDLTDGVEFREMTWLTPASFRLTRPLVLDVHEAPAAAREPGLALAGSGRGGATLGVRVTLGTPAHARVDVYDVLGRRLRTLHSGLLPVGTTPLAWDRRDADGCDVAAGVYFVRLVTPQGTHSAKAAILR